MKDLWARCSQKEWAEDSFHLKIHRLAPHMLAVAVLCSR